MNLSSSELQHTTFTARDAFLPVDGTQAGFIKDKAPRAFQEAWILPLSLHAYAAGVRLGHKRLARYYDALDFAACNANYHGRALHQSRSWLTEMQLEYRVGNIDIAELDAPNQFLFFLHAEHIAGLLERLVARHPEISTFYAITGDTPLPLDFYFDSDVTAALAAWVCARLGREFRKIEAPELRRHILPRRNVASVQQDTTVNRAVLHPGKPRVGLAPATIRNAEDLRGALSRLRCDVVLFPSELWEAPALGALSQSDSEQVCRLSSATGEGRSAHAEELSALFEHFIERRKSSSLPACIIDNPHMLFQFEHIFRTRWLGYANMIGQARMLADTHPLDLFIHCQHFTAEGAILAHVYGKHGTKIVVTQHSGWPADPNWLSPRHADFAFAWSKSCARRLKEYDREAKIVVTGTRSPVNFRNALAPQSSDEAVADVRRIAGDRKVVLLLTNALELHAVPFTDLAPHFATLSAMAAVPAHLADRILLLVRAKPAPVGEDPIIYETLANFPAHSHVLTNNLSFSDCIALADCVVGANVPTTAYFEVFDQSVPLVHVQTCAALSLQPDLPAKVVDLVERDADLWPAIETVLFDTGKREALIRRQEAFIRKDRQPTFDKAQDVVQAGLEYALGRRTKFQWLDRLRPLPKPNDAAPLASGPHPNADALAQAQVDVAGHVDLVSISPDGRDIVVQGWAAALAGDIEVVRIHLFDASNWLGSRRPTVARNDVALAFNNPRLEYSGFAIRCHVPAHSDVRKIRLYAELNDASFFPLELPTA